MPKHLLSLLAATFVLSLAGAGNATADDLKDKELEAMDVATMNYVEARMSEDCHLQTRQDGSQYVVNRDECQETLSSLEDELSGINGFGHELKAVEDFRETYNI
jgi:hypothetical protein